MPKRRCFILGAGFSKCCGFPLASELTHVVWRSRARRDHHDESANPALIGPCDFGYEQLEADFKAIRLRFPNCKCDLDQADTWPDFEELITVLDEEARFQQAFERIKGRSVTQRAGNAKRNLLRSLEDHLQQVTDRIPCHGLGVIKGFIKGFDLKNDCVISFNWDALLEVAANDLEIPVVYQDRKECGLHIAKPHGSVNLVDLPLANYEEASKSINVHSLDEEWRYTRCSEEWVVLRAQGPRKARMRQGWATQRLLVEPNTRKLYQTPWLEQQWVRALEIAVTAEELIVIGFSLPEADLRPRLLLQLSGTWGTRPSPPPVTLVDPNAEELLKHYENLTGLEIEPFVGGLEKWVGS